MLVFRDLHIDDAAQVAFSQRLGRVEVLGTGEHPEIFLVTLDPARNPAGGLPARARSTGTSTASPTTSRSWRRCSSAHGVAESGGETEFASTYAAYDDLTDDEKERFESIRVVPHDRGHPATARPRPHAGGSWPCGARGRPRSSRSIWQHRSGRRSVVLGPTADHVVGMDHEEGEALLDDVMERATAPDRVYRHQWQVGDLVIWDNRGVAAPGAAVRPETSPRDMHRTTLTGDEAIASSAA